MNAYIKYSNIILFQFFMPNIIIIIKVSFVYQEQCMKFRVVTYNLDTVSRKRSLGALVDEMSFVRFITIRHSIQLQTAVVLREHSKSFFTVLKFALSRQVTNVSRLADQYHWICPRINHNARAEVHTWPKIMQTWPDASTMSRHSKWVKEQLMS